MISRNVLATISVVACLGSGRREQVNEFLVELLFIQVDLYLDRLHVHLGPILFRPCQNVPVPGTVVDINIHEPRLVLCDQTWIQPRE